MQKDHRWFAVVLLSPRFPGYATLELHELCFEQRLDSLQRLEHGA